MIVRSTMLTLLAVATIAPSAAVARTNLSRQEIRAMPILERPSRVGHFYGNSVRRSNSRRSGGTVATGAAANW